LSLREAHRQSTELEEKIRELRDGHVEVNIHIERWAGTLPRRTRVRRDETAFSGDRGVSQPVAVEIRRARELPRRALRQVNTTFCFVPLHDEERAAITQIHDVTAYWRTA